MSKKDIGGLLIIAFLSGILKSKREDFLPPPPPFPRFNPKELNIKEKQKESRKEKKLEKNPIKNQILRQETQLDKELKELEKSEIKIPEIKPKKTKLISKIEERIDKPEEIKKAEEEIQRAIEGIKNHKEKKSIFKKLFSSKEKKAEEELPVEFMPRTYEKKDRADDVLSMIHQARNALMEFNLDKAKGIYMEIMRIYNDLSFEDKKKVYQDIKDLYDERKNAEALNIR